MTRKLFLAVALAAVAAPALGQEPVRAEEVECRGWGDRDSDRYCEERAYLLSARDALDLDAGQNGGIAVRGWDRDEIEVVATIQARAEDALRAREIADAVEVRLNGVIRPDGPRLRGRDDEHWSVSFELRVPRSTRLRLDARNGGIRLDGLAGVVEARTTNGGISVLDSGGRIRGETTNGGLRIELTGETWRGDGLDLRSTNGGVRIGVPEGYSAELETGTVNGGIELDFPVTVQGQIRRSIRTTLGEGGPLIRARTTNGGVEVRRN